MVKKKAKIIGNVSFWGGIIKGGGGAAPEARHVSLHRLKFSKMESSVVNIAKCVTNGRRNKGR